MGCDIHLKTFIFSKTEKRMVPLDGCLTDSRYASIPCIVGERNYDLFGLFGNDVRSNYPELDCLNEGFPEFLKDSTVLNIQDNVDNHTRRWCWIWELKKSLKEYYERLMDPRKWYEWDEDENSYAAMVLNGNIDLVKYREHHAPLALSIQEILKKIDKLERMFGSERNEYVDGELIMFVTWMNN